MSRKLSTLLLDTNFFLDAYQKQKREEFGAFIDSLRTDQIALVSIAPVRFEFIRSRTRDVLEQKSRYFDRIVESVLPIDKTTQDLILGLMIEYREWLEGVPITDLFLGACLKRYHGLGLLTRDHKDFPTTIFTRGEIFHFPSERDIKTYAIYSYLPEKEKVEEELPF